MTSMSPRVALVEDDDDLRLSTAQMLDLAGFVVDAFPAAAPALAAIDADYDGIVVTDVRMPMMSGIDLFHALHARDATLPVVLVTGHGDVAMAVDTLKAGAWDFLAKPFDPAALIAAVVRAATARALELDNRRLRAAVDRDAAGTLIGTSPAIERMRAMIPALADADIGVFVEGETGTGKAMLARAIHRAGKRTRHRFLPVACAAMSDVLLDDDLFASVGDGSVVTANRGTLFLDDLDQASRALQGRLAALVEDRALRRPGLRDAVPIDLRVIATGGEGAEDAIVPALFHRIAGVRLRMPPLRERREDMAPLFARFVADAAVRLGRDVPPLTEAVQRHLATHDWPGNVRELAHFADRFVLGLEATTAPAIVADAPLTDRLAQFERAAIIDAVAAARGEIGVAIDHLGIPRKTFYYRVQRLGIDLRQLRRDAAGGV